MKKKILLVDDNEALTIIVKRLLELNNYSVRAVLSVRDAEKVISASERFDLAIVDMKLPNGQPETVVGWLRIKWPDTPIIFISGAIYDDHFKVMRKPFTLEELLAAVKERIGE